MKTITAPLKYKTVGREVSVFLAGGIVGCQDWQTDVIKSITCKSFGTNLVIYNPRRPSFPIDDQNAAEEQIAWEFEALNNADIFSMYFDGGESDQPICMYELGRNIARICTLHPGDFEKRIVVTCSPDYKRKKDVEVQVALATSGKVKVDILDDRMVADAYDLHANKILDAYEYLASRIGKMDYNSAEYATALVYESLFDEARNMAMTLQDIDSELRDAAQCEGDYPGGYPSENLLPQLCKIMYADPGYWQAEKYKRKRAN